MAGIPIAPLRLRETPERREVWDLLRRRWVALTPEEHVRQSLVHYLMEDRGFPRALMSLEKGLRYQGMARRYDLLIYDRAGLPLVLCECKAPGVPLSQETVMQVSLYNSQIGAAHLLLCNGRELLYYRREAAGFTAQETLPHWQEFLPAP